MRNFEKLPQRPIENDLCDVVVDKPTFIMKIDAGELLDGDTKFSSVYGKILIFSGQHVSPFL
jgi:hypothetical protein